MAASTSLSLELVPEELDAEVLRAPFSLAAELESLLDPDLDLPPSDPGSLLELPGLMGGLERRPRDIFLHC